MWVWDSRERESLLLRKGLQTVSLANYPPSRHASDDTKLSHAARRLYTTEMRWCFLLLSALIVLRVKARPALGPGLYWHGLLQQTRVLGGTSSPPACAHTSFWVGFSSPPPPAASQLLKHRCLVGLYSAEMGVLGFASLKPDVPKGRSNPQCLWAGHLLRETGFLGGGQLRWMGCVLQHDGGMDVCPTAKEHRRRCCAHHGDRGGLLPQEGAGGTGPRSLLSPWRGVIASSSWHTDLAGLAWEGHPHRGPHPWIACEIRARSQWLWNFW